MDDSKIIELFYERSEQAIVELSGKYGTICKRIAYHILKNRLDAEECINDAYLGVWNTIPPQRPNPLLSYVCRIVRNLAVKKYHANTAIKRNSIYDVALDELENCFPSSDSVEEAVSAREIGNMINEFLGQISRENRILFVRRYWYCDSIAELAACFHTTNHTISVRLSRIREKLRQYLMKEGVFL